MTQDVTEFGVDVEEDTLLEVDGNKVQGKIGRDKDWEIELEQSGERVEVWEIDCLLELLF